MPETDPKGNYLLDSKSYFTLRCHDWEPKKKKTRL